MNVKQTVELFFNTFEYCEMKHCEVHKIALFLKTCVHQPANSFHSFFTVTPFSVEILPGFV